VETELVKLDSQIIDRRDPLVALRLFELAVNKLCQLHDLKLSFLFDEFDEMYRTLPKEIFHQLRAIRDANKYRISFILFLRNMPEKIREPREIESFYELLNRKPIGIGPFQREDALRIIQQWEARKQHPINDKQREIIFQAGGGHAGLMSALLSILIDRPDAFQKLYSKDWAKQLVSDPAIMDECMKIWNGLLDEEKERFPDFLTELYKQTTKPIDTMLFAKKLLIRVKGDEVRFFSELFKQYVLNMKLKATPT
jgi:ASC-1-like (ASCH) protein